MRWRTPGLLLTCTTIVACSHDSPLHSVGVQAPPTITDIQTLPHNPLGIVIAHAGADPLLVRAHLVSSDSSDKLITTWQRNDSAIVVLGLKPAQTYSVSVEVLMDGTAIPGAATTYTAPSLPPGLSQVGIHIDGKLSGGYSISPIAGSDGHSYLIMFDSLGVIRWYRDFGPQVVFATTQQEDGNFTAFVGNSTGFNVALGLYVEVTPYGDSVRTVSALGSPFTDPHELLESFNSRGDRVADYLFGYTFMPIDRTAVGGGPSDTIAVHQVLRINTAGSVDTLIAGDEHWDAADDVAPELINDLDHPNSIDFDLDGGVIVSYRDLSSIVKVNRRTHAFAWVFGGTHNQFTILNDPFGGFDSQHTARVLPDGHLLIFDNGWSHTPQQSRAVEYQLDTVSKSATMVWQYSASPPIFNDFTGSAQRLANGNTVIAFTRHGIVDEVSPNGTLLGRVLLESAPGRVATPYRVTRIGSLYDYQRP